MRPLFWDSNDPEACYDNPNLRWGIGWSFQGFGKWLSSCEFMVDRGDGKGFVHLVTDTTPNYTDTQPFPTAKAIWTYKAVFFVDDAPVGQWSVPVSVTVGG